MDPRLPEFEPRALLARLTERGVDFVIIGGFAAVIHGAPTVTQDLDICYAGDPANLRVLGDVLVELEARPRGAPSDVPFVPDARTLSQVSLLTLETRLGKLDLLATPDGAPGYERLRRNAWRADIGGLAVLVASLDDLIAMKLAAGRAKDLAAVEELEAIDRLRQQASAEATRSGRPVE